jgi:hypothetical protein
MENGFSAVFVRIKAAFAFFLHSKQELFHLPNRCVFSLKERDDREQEVQQFPNQLRVALIEFSPFDAIDEPLDLGRVSGGNVIVVFHRWRSRRSYARQKRTPRPERKYFLFSRGLSAGTVQSGTILEQIGQFRHSLCGLTIRSVDKYET